MLHDPCRFVLPCASRDAGWELEVAKRIVMAASRLLGATAAYVILLSFAAGHCKLYSNDCIKSARVICQRIFAILSLMIFLLKLFLKSASKSCFFPLASRSGFGAAISSAVARSSSVLCNSVSADRNVMAASRLLGATAACVILLSFAAGHCKLYWNGCIKSARVICQRIFAILSLMIFLLKTLFKSASKSCFFPLASRSGFGAAISSAVARSSSVLCNSVSADRIVMAASRFYGCVRNTIFFCSWTS